MYGLDPSLCNTTTANPGPSSHDSIDLAAEARGSIGPKIGSMLVLFFLPLFLGLLPLKAVKMKNAARYTSIANCFGGGVFFGTCFIHLIPEVAIEVNMWRDTVDNAFVQSLPIAEILECIGFVLIMFAESVVSSMGHGHSHTGHQPLPEDDEEEDGGEKMALKSNGNNTADAITPNNNSNNNNSTVVAAASDTRTKSVGVLIFALAVHSVFEGLAIAVEARTSVFLQLAGAILIHKCVVAFAVGTRLIEAGLKLKWGILGNLMIFCISMPIGMAIAMVILETLSMAPEKTIALVSGLIQGLSTGFFLYITFVEMICDEMRDGKDLLVKVLVLSLGILLIGISTVVHNYSDIKANQ